MRTLMTATTDYTELDGYFAAADAKCVLLVCGGSIRKLRLNTYFETLEQSCGIRVVRFSDFNPNPDFSSAVKGLATYRANGCDMLAAVGGGSAIDVAKCIKLCISAPDPEQALHQPPVPNTVPFIAIPTTAGSGSEATHFAVVYENGVKQSAEDDSLLPDAVLFDPDALKTLPPYQKKSTMLDAVCHAVESYWSLHSDADSMKDAAAALRLIAANKDDYLAGTDTGCRNMLKAAHFAGKAINVTKTTAGHAMCYQLTMHYGISHGHAAALCVKALLPFMTAHPDLCIDTRGAAHLHQVYTEIAEAMGCTTAAELPTFFAAFVDSLLPGIETPAAAAELDMLTCSVNADRLSNHPVQLTADTIRQLYAQILEKEQMP